MPATTTFVIVAWSTPLESVRHDWQFASLNSFLTAGLTAPKIVCKNVCSQHRSMPAPDDLSAHDKADLHRRLPHLVVEVPDPHFQVGQQYPDGELLQKLCNSFHISRGQAGAIPSWGHGGPDLGLPCTPTWQRALDVGPPEAVIACIAVAACLACTTDT